MVRTLAAFAWLMLLSVAGLPAQAAAVDAAPTARPHVSLMLGIARIGDRLVVVGERGRILLSDDSGRTWRAVASGTGATLNMLRFIDAKTGFAVGWDATILRTDDAGDSWTKVNSDPSADNGLFDVTGLPDGGGLAVGAYGLAFLSPDGKSWTIEHNDTLDPDAHMNALFAPEPGHLVIAGEAGSIYVSDDAGKNWRHLEFPYEGSLFGGFAFGPRDWLVYGLRGHVFRTQDGGEHWVPIETGTTQGIMGSTTLKDGRVVLVGSGGIALLSDAAVTGFTVIPHPETQTLSGVAEAPDGSLVAVGDIGVSTDESSIEHLTVPAKVAAR
ncbi:MAG: YCF48-related protein [Aliidongia sp.]